MQAGGRAGLCPWSTARIAGAGYDDRAGRRGADDRRPDAADACAAAAFRPAAGRAPAARRRPRQAGRNAPGAGLLRAFSPLAGRARTSSVHASGEQRATRNGKRKGKRHEPRLLIPAHRRIKQAGKATSRSS